ncbi:carbamoyl-phosphate synthase large subunit [Aeromicrobium sp. Marseille-Q0843]|uniref:acetyl-CoA carboxylase n=1 Tax=Aeromicrobium phoceense TaxID=2754045 RepID=A0A838XM45_9ACTN|nr:carboxyl transferase domain-containing protein [Aeromicrobium phoceense]MBA4608033.1 carbamoyl-phosphate synthase large subunit [Aeromicrobium phoceense]
MKVLIANRGEIAHRIERAVRALDWTPQHVHTAEEAGSADPESYLLPKAGVAGYLDVEAIVAAAVLTGSDLVHPGYGFLSESAELARACEASGLTFVGPDPTTLELFGDKGSAREHALAHGVPVLDATGRDASLAEVAALLERHPAGIMIKAVSGGGGRGMRPVTDAADLAEAYDRCRSEAERAFGNSSVYAERLLASAKHIEVQVLGDGARVVTLGERECSVQRRHQKVIEVAPSPSLTDAHRERLTTWAKDLTAPLGYRGLATVEFLVNADLLRRGGPLDAVFIEVNPRLQVEHTVTEEVTGTDLVRAQLLVAARHRLDEVGVPTDVQPRPGVVAIQSRVNAEEVVGGTVVSTTGTVTGFSAPDGVRVDTGIAAGTVVDGTFDSLLAKVVTVTEGDHATACADADAAVAALRIEGVRTNVPLLRELLAHDAVRSGEVTTAWLDRLLADRADSERATDESGTVSSVMNGTVLAVSVKPGDTVGPKTPLATLESMKMEHPVTAGFAGTVTEVLVATGEQVAAGQPIAVVAPDDTVDHQHAEDADVDLDHIRPDLAELQDRIARTRDSARTEAVAKRHARGHLTAREWVDLLVDEGTFTEYGALTVAAQRQRRTLDDLMDNTPADGIITGLGTINGDDSETSRRCAVLAYDYTVLAGTQGYFNHKKTDRLLELARDRKLPVVLFAEGGGGRPGDTDTADLLAAGLNVRTFATMGSLSGVVPTVGILTGRCFAGNAALLGCCDVIIGTEDANLGMAGPAMIEGGGLGVFTPEQIGPMSVQGPNGVVDIVVGDDAEAISVAQRYLSYFQGGRTAWDAADQRRLRHVIGENRKQVYDIRTVIDALVDTDSVLELRREFGTGAITALVRIEGRAYGLVANNPAHLGGAIDADAADKMARFLQLCDAHGLPVVSLCDTPGFMVGPESEQTATVRHFSRLFVIAAHLKVPMTTIVLRKAYGLGAQAMAAGGFAQTTATVSWPTGEIGGMGLEGAVRLGFSKELAAIEDEQARADRYEELVAQHYEAGKAINGAMKLELDEVIDPADTRRWIVATLGDWDGEGSHRFVDTW